MNHRLPTKKYKYEHIGQTELNRYTSQFYGLFRARYGDYAEEKDMKASRKFPPFTASPREHIQRMAERFSRWVDSDPDFCQRVRQNGVAATCTKSLLRRLSELSRIEQYQDHLKVMPSKLFAAELRVLDFADTRDDGLLLPFCVDRPGTRQKKLLTALVKEKYLEESSTAAAAGSSRTDDSDKKSGLTLTDLGSERVADLADDGWFVTRKASDPLHSWCQVNGVHYNLQITKFGSAYLSDWRGGRNSAPEFIEGEDGDLEYLRSPTSSPEEILDGKELQEHLPLTVQLLEKLEEEQIVEQGMAKAFGLFFEDVLNQQEIAEEVGKSDTTISRWKKTFTRMLVDPEFRHSLRRMAEANKPK
jgi:hypothetical protein